MTVIPKTKTCSKCLETKAFSEFHKDKYHKDGLRSHCKRCVKGWRTANRKQILLKNKEWRENNKEHLALKLREWQKANRERCVLNNKEWRAANPEKRRKMGRVTNAKRRSVPKFKVSNNISRRICFSIKSQKAGRHWEDLVDFTLEELMEHLEGHFNSSMTWENHGSYWHIDHIKPISSFGFKTPEDLGFKQCWALENLQPLEAKQNISKGAKLDWQPTGEIK